MSIGVACFPEEGETTEELLTAAARKMQSDKHSRKTVLTLANSPDQHASTLSDKSAYQLSQAHIANATCAFACIALVAACSCLAFRRR